MSSLTDLEKRIETLAGWIHKSDRLVVFTGAGISTDSGLPDFRGPDGVWTRRDKGLPPSDKKLDWTSVEPNLAHIVIADIQALGKLQFLISQNIDNLHLKSGIEFDRLAELHGNLDRIRCRVCEETYPKSLGLDGCTSCGGDIKSSVVDFGDSLPQKDMTEAFEHSQSCDLFVVVGSSLVVTPAANMPSMAKQSGARLVIINKGETPLDRMADLRFSEGIADVLPPAVEKLKKLMQAS